VNSKEKLILDILSRHGELMGADVRKISVGKLSKGIIYVYLDRLEDGGYIVSRKLGRRFYEITEKGLKEIKNEN